MERDVASQPAFFITATGTEVGKTYISALLVKTLREAGIDAGYYKPALSDAQSIEGKLVPGDAAYVCETAGLDVDPASLVSYMYSTPVAPHLAARLEGQPAPNLATIERDFLRHRAEHETLIVEGCGGIICPLADEPPLMLSDVIKALDIPLVIVTQSGLGALNAALLTVAFARQEKMKIHGIIMNDYDELNPLHSDNAYQIEHLCGVPVIAQVKHGDTRIGLTNFVLY